jgi:5-formyltetrahydrofolate cyclo-ligase
MWKKEIRKTYLSRRKSLTTAQVGRMQDLLLIQAQHAGLPLVGVLHHYLADQSNNEPDPLNIVRWMRFMSPGLLQVVPKILKDGIDMDAVKYESGDALTPNRYGIAEPVEADVVDPESIDLIFVPFLAFDLDLNRVGYGKGYYDRFLLRCRPDCLKVGLGFFDPVEQISDVHPGDVRLDICITPEGIY